MRMLRGYRVGGDSLSTWFGPDGSLSTAYLEVLGAKYLVASQLPGLRADNGVLYVQEIGFRSYYDPICLAIGKEVNKVLQKDDLFVESVYRQRDTIHLSVVSHFQRTRACPCRLFVAVYTPETDHVQFRSTRDLTAVDVFYKRVVVCERIGSVRV